MDGGYAQSLSDLDRELVRLLYLPEVEVGMSLGTVRKKLMEIYDRENQE